MTKADIVAKVAEEIKVSKAAAAKALAVVTRLHRTGHERGWESGPGRVRNILCCSAEGQNGKESPDR